MPSIHRNAKIIDAEWPWRARRKNGMKPISTTVWKKGNFKGGRGKEVQSICQSHAAKR